MANMLLMTATLLGYTLAFAVLLASCGSSFVAFAYASCVSLGPAAFSITGLLCATAAWMTTWGCSPRVVAGTILCHLICLAPGTELNVAVFLYGAYACTQLVVLAAAAFAPWAVLAALLMAWGEAAFGPGQVGVFHALYTKHKCLRTKQLDTCMHNSQHQQQALDLAAWVLTRMTVCVLLGTFCSAAVLSAKMGWTCHSRAAGVPQQRPSKSWFTSTVQVLPQRPRPTTPAPPVQ